MKLMPAPLSRKAVLITEKENGGVAALTIYDPVLQPSYDDEFSTTSRNSLSFTEGQMFVTDPSNAEKRAEVAQTYAQAQQDAMVAGAQKLPARITPEDLTLMADRAHEDAIQAVYQLGVAAGAKMVQFRDAHVEKELKQIPMDLLWQIGLRLDRVLAQAGKKSQLGLKKARRLVAEMYDEALKEQD